MHSSKDIRDRINPHQETTVVEKGIDHHLRIAMYFMRTTLLLGHNVLMTSSDSQGTRLFATHRHWLHKVGLAGLVGLVLTLPMWSDRSLSAFEKTIGSAVVSIVAMVVAIVLNRKDLVRRRLLADEPVDVFSRLLFGAGVRSLLIWTVVLLILGFPVAIWIGNMTSDMPAR